MTWQTTLYFSSIVLTCVLTGFLAWYAWRQPALPGVRMYAALALCECLLALAEILSMLSGTQTQALFWFKMRFIFNAIIPVLWLTFSLEYSGRKDWLSKRLLAGMFIIPFITLFMLWSNLQGLWLKHEVTFHQNGPFWIAETSARIPGPWFMVHIFYSLIFLLVGIGLILFTAWNKRQHYRGQALVLAGGALVALAIALIPIFNLFPQSEFNPFIPGIGLSAFLYALAIFRFQFLKHSPAQNNAPQMSGLNAQEKRSLAVFIFIFILFTSGIATASYLTYQNYEKQFRVQVESQLSTVAFLKVDELQDWRNKQLMNANLFYQNGDFSDEVHRYLEDPTDIEIQNKLGVWLKKMQANPEYERVSLLDTEGYERISFPTAPELPNPHLVEQVDPVLNSGQVTMLDFHRDIANGPIHLSILIPLFDQQNGSPLGVLVLRINPYVYLYPLIQQWPVSSQSAETLLVRRDGADALYLNELKFKENAALNLRIPLEETQVLSVQALLGQTGIVHGLDYRGVEVIGDVRAVPSQPWFLISKIDTAEVYAPLRIRLRQTIFLFGALILSAGIGLVLFWRQQRLNYYRSQNESAESLRKSQEQYRGLIEHAADGIFVADASGKYLEVNPSGCAMLGYTRDEILSLRISALVASEDMAAAPLRLEELRQGKTVLSERRLICKDGSLLPVEISGRMLPDGRFQSIIRDITERKQAENALRESEETLRALLNAVHESMFLMKPDGTTIAINDTTADRLHAHVADMIGHNIFSFLPPDLADSRRAYVEEVIASGKPARFEDERHGKWLDNSIYPVIDETGRVTHLAVYGNEITERKQAEEVVKRSERKYRKLHESMMDGFVCVAMDGTFLECNEVYRNMLGYSETELEKITYVDLTPKKWHAFEADIVENQIIKRGYSDIYEKEYCRKDGTIFPVELRTVLTRDENGNPVNMWGIARDITERKQAETALQKSEQRFREIFENTNDAIYIWSLGEDGTIAKGAEVNDVACKRMGYSKEEFLQISPVAINAGNIREKLPGMVAPLLSQGQMVTEALHRTKDGRIIPVEISSRIVELMGEKKIISLARDITERKQAEDFLRESERKLREAQEMAHLGFWLWDVKTGHVEWSEEVFKIFCLDPKGFTPRIDSILDLSPWPEDHQRDQELIDRAIETHTPGGYEQKFLRPDQSIGYYYSTFQGNYDENGGLISIVGTVLDITERKQAEEKLIVSEVRYRRLFEAARDGIFILDAETGMVLDVNPFMIEMLGFSREAFLDKALWELGFFKDIAANKANFLELQQNEYIKYENLPLETQDGRLINVEFVSNVYQVNSHKVIQCNIRDITERKRAENAQQQSEVLFRMLFELSPDAVVLLDPHDSNVSSPIVDCNAAACLMSGYDRDELIGQPIDIVNADPYTQAGQTAYLEKLRDAGNLKYEVLHRRKNGTVFPVEVSTAIIKVGERELVIGIDRDITERKQIEESLQEYNTRLASEVEQRTHELRKIQEQLVRQERLAALGQLAGSIGHELRNPLGVISNSVYYLKLTQPNASEVVKEYLDIIDNETRTSDKIITDLLDFTRIKSQDRQPASASKLIHQALERRQIPSSVETALEIPADLPQIYADPQHVIQVLVNLISNACQSMDNELTTGKKLTVSATAQGAMIKIDIQDTGVGIPPDNMKKLFEPLFTTKIKGIGLGLAVSRKLTEANGGRIEVQSEADKGSTFTVYLPVYKESA